MKPPQEEERYTFFSGIRGTFILILTDLRKFRLTSLFLITRYTNSLDLFYTIYVNVLWDKFFRVREVSGSYWFRIKVQMVYLYAIVIQFYRNTYGRGFHLVYYLFLSYVCAYTIRCALPRSTWFKRLISWLLITLYIDFNSTDING